MRCSLLIVTAFLAVLVSVPAAHAGPLSVFLPSRVPDCIQKYYCDDYRPKTAPCPQPVSGFRDPDYCPKRPPCPQPVSGFECPDYDPKCPPRPCGPLPPSLTFGPHKR
ncbi:MAG: hypothetical protein ACC645_24020 [Pirellulales bacterium]